MQKAKRLIKKLFRAVANYDPDYYDMYADTREQLFAKLYLERILMHCRQAGILPPASILDAGCQTGRLMIPLAQAGYRVSGIDTSGFALRKARRHLAQANTSATLIRGDLLGVLQRRAQDQYDVAVCAEVLYLSSDYRKMLEVLARSVRRAGLLFVSHRPLAYYLIEALKTKDYGAAERVLSSREGRFEGSQYFNWQTENDLQRLYESLHLKVIAMHPIDRLAWLSGTDVAQLSQESQSLWLKAELESIQEFRSVSRYVLVVSTQQN